MNDHVVRRVTVSSGEVSTLAGKAGVSGYADGVGTIAELNGPTGIAVDSAGTFALIVSVDGGLLGESSRHCQFLCALLLAVGGLT